MPTRPPKPPSDLFPEIYDELRSIAGRYLGRERRDHTLQPTALVHEAWLKLRNERGAGWHGRTHGLALAAQAMRRLLVDHGRRQKRRKRGDGVRPVSFDDVVMAGSAGAVPIEDLLALETALGQLEKLDPRAAQIVALRFLSGLTVGEVAEHLGISTRTVEGDWTHARAWLTRELSGRSTT